MTLTQATDYAFRAVLYLAKLPMGEVVDAQTIARSEAIPMRFLLKIFRGLTKAGLVKSFRGVGGGYALLKKPKEISLLDVVEAVEGPIRMNSCLYGETSYCSSRSGKCVIHDVLWETQQEVIRNLSAVNFAGLVEKELHKG